MSTLKRQSLGKSRGFSLIELLIVVALIGILSAIGIPMLQGMISDAKISTAKNNLQSIYVAQLEYKSDNGSYYNTGGGNKTNLINSVLFSGNQTLDLNSDHYYYISANSTMFTAFAMPRISGLQTCRITQTKFLSCY